jgi:LmbE family N-acetylglucosaminyl deacetylase/SAM-dependent methyltransferase
MVSFDGSAAGTAPEHWAADPRLARLESLALPCAGPVIVVAPHPDDETLGAGGLIARLEDAGIAVVIVVVTDGAASAHPVGVSAATLVDTRRLELRSAVRVLAPTATVRELGFADGGVREERHAVKRALMDSILEVQPSLVIAPWAGDGHRDHRIVGELCAEICWPLMIRMIEYPVWMWHWADSASPEVPWRRMRALELTVSERRLKAAAIRRYASQTDTADDAAATLHSDFVRHFMRLQEVYMDSDGPMPADYFDDLYARHDDPWSFETRWYEKRKRALTMAALPREGYGSVLEVGCSTGLLTAELAARADRLLAIDIADYAVAATSARTAGLPGVTVELRDFSEGVPEGPFDLVVLSEVGYYLDAETLAVRLRELAASLAPGGELLLCHWRHEVADYPLTGGQVHRAADALEGLSRFISYVDEDVELGVYSADTTSVAKRTGLL